MKIGLPRLVGNGVKVAVVALSVAEWYMNVYSRHYFCFSVSVGNGNAKVLSASSACVFKGGSLRICYNSAMLLIPSYSLFLLTLQS